MILMNLMGTLKILDNKIKNLILAQIRNYLISKPHQELNYKKMKMMRDPMDKR